MKEESSDVRHQAGLSHHGADCFGHGAPASVQLYSWMNFTSKPEERCSYCESISGEFWNNGLCYNVLARKQQLSTGLLAEGSG